MTFTPQDIANAIRQNGYPQIQGSYIRWGASKPLGACALGQAALNLYGVDIMKSEEGDVDNIAEVLDDLGLIVCPEFDVRTSGTRTAGSMVIHLNDDHNWTTTQIADWLDGVIKERAQ